MLVLDLGCGFLGLCCSLILHEFIKGLEAVRSIWGQFLLAQDTPIIVVTDWKHPIGIRHRLREFPSGVPELFPDRSASTREDSLSQGLVGSKLSRLRLCRGQKEGTLV